MRHNITPFELLINCSEQCGPWAFSFVSYSEIQTKLVSVDNMVTEYILFS